MSGGWSKQSGGDKTFFKFTVPGDTLIGKWVGTREGKYGKNGLVQTKDDGIQEFNLNTAIENLGELEKGCPVKIVYIGKQTSKGGNEFKAFDTFIWDQGKEKDDEVSKFSGPIENPSSSEDDDVPF